MKKIFYLVFILSSLFLTSCSSNTNKNNDTHNETTKNQVSGDNLTDDEKESLQMIQDLIKDE